VPNSAAVLHGALRCGQQTGSGTISDFLPRRAEGRGAGALALLGQHDRDHALGDRRIRRIGGVVREALVVVLDLDADRFTNLFQARDRDLMRRRR
jgi:hypothetical protein